MLAYFKNVTLGLSELSVIAVSFLAGIAGLCHPPVAVAEL